MFMIKLLSCFLFISFPLNSYGQFDNLTNIKTLNRTSLIKKLSVDSKAVFVVNGIGYSEADSLLLDNMLKNIAPETILYETSIINKGQIGIGNKDIVFVLYANLLKAKDLKIKYKEALGLFRGNDVSYGQSIFQETKEPNLIVDNNQIQYNEAKNVLKRLKKKDLANVYISDVARDTSLYGKNTKNGVVIIWTKKGLKKIQK